MAPGEVALATIREYQVQNGISSTFVYLVVELCLKPSEQVVCYGGLLDDKNAGELNTQSWKVILSFEIFHFADIRETKVSDLRERRAKILR